MGRRRIGGLAPLLAALACQGAPRGPALASTSILLDPTERTVWLASPDDDRVVAVSAETLAVERAVAVPGAPRALAWATLPGGDRLVVALERAAAVALVDPATGAVGSVTIPCAGAVAVLAAGADALVACPHDDRVVRVDLAAGAVTAVMASPGRPSALALSGDRLAVLAARTGRVRLHSMDTSGAAAAEELALETEPGFAASGGAALAVDPERGGFTAAFSRVDHDADRARAPERGGYGAVVDGAPRIEPRLGLDCAGGYARFDGGLLAMSGPAAVARRGPRALVAHLFTDDVAVLDCGGDGPVRPVVATYRGGRGPRGLAVTADGRRAFVDVAFDHAVARLALDAAGGPLREPELVRRRDPGPTALSARALRGRALFHDAVDVHLTPSGVVTCATCHPGGGEDGLAWFLHTPGIPRKLRRTPPAWSGRPALAPHHWDGEFADAGALTARTLRELLEGDGLLVDVEAIAAYLAELPPPPPRPAEGEEVALRREGEAVFARAGCAACHPAPLFADGLAHAVLEPSLDPDAALDRAFTPTLRGVRTRPPYLHDGRAPDLRAVLEAHNPRDRHGATRALDARALDALVAYLESL